MVPPVREVSILSLCGLNWFTYQLCLENLRQIQCVTRSGKELVQVAIVFQFICHLRYVSDS